ncbi:MAG TPA: BatD family protein, partial [Gammaproteobacteria bacterium]
MRAPRTLTNVSLVLLLSPVAAAAEPQVQLAISQGPYYAGVPVTVQISADGFDEEPQPEIRALSSNPDDLRFVGVSPNVSRSVRIVNGQITQSTLVRFTFAYELLPRATGRYRIGPFEVVQGAASSRTGVTDIVVEEVPIGGDQRIRVILPDGDLFVGQRVPVRIEWWVSGELAGSLFNQRIRVPLLDPEKPFSVVDATSTDQDGETLRASLVLYSANGAAEYPASESLQTEDSEQWVVRRVELTLLASEPGVYRPEPASLVVDQATRWRRDLFGSRIPTQARKLRAVDEPLEIRVLDLPNEGRPPSFTGAIGEGFVLEANADRTVVQVGDPVTISLTLRGAGNIDTAAPPIVIGEHALSSRDFSLSRKPTAGVYDGNEKRFDAIIRVQRPTVTEIPPIEYAWFDPTTARFETTASRPIALSVRDARIVGAGDVVHKETGEEDDATGESSAHDSSVRGDPDAPRIGSGAPSGSFSLTGADLSIETDIGLLAPARSGRSA